jgi:phage gpG-like protein
MISLSAIGAAAILTAGMAKATIEFSWNFPKLFEQLQAQQERIEQTIASTIQTQVGMRFDQEGASNGHEKWKPLSPLGRVGQILSKTGTLRKSMSPMAQDGKAGPGGFVNQSGNVSDLLVEVGSTLIYASTQNNGAIIVPVNKKALRYEPVPGSGKFVFSRKSVIPARPFTDRNQTDTDELQETLGNLIADIIGGTRS